MGDIVRIESECLFRMFVSYSLFDYAHGVTVMVVAFRTACEVSTGQSCFSLFLLCLITLAFRPAVAQGLIVPTDFI